MITQLAIIAALTITPLTGPETTTTTVSPAGVVSAAQVDQVAPTAADLELQSQMKNKKVPPISYWNRVAQCETARDWKNGGRYAGGLGIMTSKRATPKYFKSGAGTWERFGGEEFALSPDKATKTEQIVIANRIATFGHKHYYSLPAGANGTMMHFTYNVRPVGYFGWGCIKNTIGKPKFKK